jgi:signal transduction histidine kinase
VIINFVSNAIKFSKPDTEVRLHLELLESQNTSGSSFMEDSLKSSEDEYHNASQQPQMPGVT